MGASFHVMLSPIASEYLSQRKPREGSVTQPREVLGERPDHDGLAELGGPRRVRLLAHGCVGGRDEAGVADVAVKDDELGETEAS